MVDQRSRHARQNIRQAPPHRMENGGEVGAPEDGRPTVEVDLLKTPEAAAAHAAHGTTAHIRAADSETVGESDTEPGEESEAREHVGRKVAHVFPGMDPKTVETVTRVGFDDGSQYEVEDGRFKKKVVSAKSESGGSGSKGAEDEGK